MRVRPRSPLNFSGPEPVVPAPRDSEASSQAAKSVDETVDETAASAIEADAVAHADLAHETQPLPSDRSLEALLASYEPPAPALTPAPAETPPAVTTYRSEGVFARSGRITLNLRDPEPTHEDEDDDAPLILNTPIPNTASSSTTSVSRYRPWAARR